MNKKILSVQDLHRVMGDIKLLIIDVDGVLTDGKRYFNTEGRVMLSFNSRDEVGLKQLQRKSKLQMAIISGSSQPAIQFFATRLDFDYVMTSVEDKSLALKELVKMSGFKPEQMCHIGDDVNDLPLFHKVKLSIGVPESHQDILPHLNFMTNLPGGGGAVREVCDHFMNALNLTYDGTSV